MYKGRKNPNRTRWGLWGGMIAAGAGFATVVPLLRRRGMRVTTILKKDHRMARGLLAALERTPRGSGVVRRSLVDQIYWSLMTHERAEDDVLYPAIRSRGFRESGPEFDDAYFEQNTVKELLERLADTDPASEPFEERLQEFKQAVEQHAEREERSVFTLVETQMSSEEQQALGERLHSRKKELKKRLMAA